jgi:hypothetical protein
MKKKSLLLAAVAAVLMSGCGKEMNTDVTDSGKTASLEIRVSGANVASTKATGTPDALTEENVITNLTVGLFKKDGTTDVISEGKVTGTLESEKVTITGTGAAQVAKFKVTGTEGERTVIVVANAPTGKFAGALNIDEFRKRALDLTQVKTNLPMSGESAADAVTLTGGTTQTANVVVSRLVARIQLESLKTDFSPVGQYSNASFTLDKVFLYNAMSSSQVGVISAAELVTSLPIHGWDGTKEVGEIKNASLLDMGINALIPAAPASAYAVPYYFYAFQNYYSAGIDNTNKVTATKLVVSGWFTPDKNAPATKFYVYYPAVINRAQVGTTINGTDKDNNAVSDMSNISNTGILRNSTYSIEATIKSIGVDSPDMFMEPAALDLTVTVAPWSLKVTQKIDF